MIKSTWLLPESNRWIRLLPRPCSAWHPVLPESNGWVRLLGNLRYPSQMGEFDCLCSPEHAVLGILCYPSQISEFNYLWLHHSPCSACHLVLHESNRSVRLSSIAPQTMQCLASCTTWVKQVSLIAPKAMMCLSSCATRVKRVSLIAFDCSPGHAVLGILSYPSQTGEFDCTQGHEVLGIMCYPSETGEFNCAQGHEALGILRYWRQTREGTNPMCMPVCFQRNLISQRLTPHRWFSSPLVISSIEISFCTPWHELYQCITHMNTEKTRLCYKTNVLERIHDYHVTLLSA